MLPISSGKNYTKYSLALYVAKLIIDEVIFQVNHSPKDFNYLYLLIGFEFILAIVGDLLSRGISLTDSLLGDLEALLLSILVRVSRLIVPIYRVTLIFYGN